MVGHGWDLSSSCITITTPWLRSHGWYQFQFCWTQHFKPRWCMFRLIEALGISSTIQMSHQWYDERLYKVENGTRCLKWSSQPSFESWAGTNSAWHIPTFHTKIVWLWTDSGNSHQLDPSNISLHVYWMVGQGRDLNSSCITITIPWLLSHGRGHFLLQAPYILNQDGVCLDWFKHFTSAQPFQCLINSMMNG